MYICRLKTSSIKKYILLLATFLILITCAKDAFEEEITEVPTVFFNVKASASEGGSVDNTGGSLASGTSLAITATPEAEYLFTGWTGSDSTDNPLTVTANSNLTITANFEKRKYPLTINKVGEGTVTEEIVSTGKSTDYDSGTVVKLTAVPSSDHAFFSWDNSSSVDTINPIQITVDGNKTVGVNFDYQTDYTLSGTDRNGNVSGSDPNLTFSIGDTISFVVNASGHLFYLKTVAGTGNTISGLTNNGTESATISWTPNATGTFYYQCSLHGGMLGTITIQ